MTEIFSWDAYPIPDDLPPVIHDPSLPLVSVVTPSYNQGRLSAKRLTVCYPGLPEYRILGDRRRQHRSNAGRFARLRTRSAFHWISEPDRGQSDAINKGWRRCRRRVNLAVQR